jgi:hypothetical protein
MKALKVVTLSVIVPAVEADNMENELINSQVAQLGYYTLGVSQRHLTRKEKNEILSQLPDDILLMIL